MKKITLTLILVLFAQLAIAQCDAPVSDFGNNAVIPMYNITGSVDLTLNDDNTVTLELGANFMTAAGPDIRAFLVKSNGLSDAQLANTQIGNLENLQFGLVGSDTVNQNGAKTFTIVIPDGETIEEFDKVFFYCLQFDQFWDFGTFESFSNANCDLLSLDAAILSTLTVWPNPTSERVQVSATTNEPIRINVYSSEGLLVQSLTTSRQNESIDVSRLATGLYFVEMIITSGGTKTERLLVR